MNKFLFALSPTHIVSRLHHFRSVPGADLLCGEYAPAQQSQQAEVAAQPAFRWGGVAHFGIRHPA